MDSSKKKDKQSKSVPKTPPSAAKSLPPIQLQMPEDTKPIAHIAPAKQYSPLSAIPTSIFKKVVADPGYANQASIKRVGMAMNVVQSSNLFPKLKDSGAEQFDPSQHALMDQFWNMNEVALRAPFNTYLINPIDLLEDDIKGDNFDRLYVNAAIVVAVKMTDQLVKKTYGELPNFFDDLKCVIAMVNGNDHAACVSVEHANEILADEIRLLEAAHSAVGNDTTDFAQQVLARVQKYPGADALLGELNVALSAARKVIQYIFPMSESTPPVIRYHLNILNKWLSSADDGWCGLGLNTYALGWMTRILHSHQARRVLTTDQLSEKYAQLQAMISFELFGGKLSEWFMAVQSLVAEFAALVQTSEKYALANGDSKSNILNGDNTSIGAALKVLGGRVFKHFLNDIHSTFPTEYEKVYLQLVRPASTFGPGANLLFRQRHLLGFLSRFEEQYPSMVPPVISALPTALTLHVLIGGDSLSESPTAAATVTPAAPFPPPVPSAVSPPLFYGRYARIAGMVAGKGSAWDNFMTLSGIQLNTCLIHTIVSW